MIKLTVFGAEQICASCIGAPSSTDTFEWLQAAVSRKYQDEQVQYEYVDIFNPAEQHAGFSQEIIEQDLFYPIVLVNGVIVAEGIPQLKKISQALEQEGIVLRR